MPCFALDGELLCGFDRKEGQAIEVEEPLVEIFSQLYPELKLSELARAYRCLRPRLKPENMSSLLNIYGLRNSRRAEKFFSLFSKIPSEFRDWCDIKNPGINDLAVLFCFEDLASLKEVLQKIATDNLSKSQGVQALELCGELMLSGQVRQVTESLPIDSAAAWLAQLKRLRYPITTEKVNDREKKLSRLPWPKGTSAQLVRNGDRDCVELKIRAGSALDLQQQLDALKAFSEKQSGDWL